MIISGLDISLAATGAARLDSDARAFTSVTLKPPKKLDGHERLAWILAEFEQHVIGADLVMVEEAAYGARGTAVHKLAGIWYLITHRLWRLGIPVAVVNVGSLKLYATGNGNADKDLIMLTTGRVFPDFNGDNNAADALWLACMGADHHGVPITVVPAKQRATLSKVAWPQATS